MSEAMPQAQQILALIAAQPGITSEQVADALNHERKHICRRLCDLAGRISVLKLPRSNRYFATDAIRDAMAKAITAQHLAERAIAEDEWRIADNVRRVERARDCRAKKLHGKPGPKPKELTEAELEARNDATRVRKSAARAARRARQVPKPGQLLVLRKATPKAVPMAAREAVGMDTARRTVSKAPLDSRYFVDPTKPIVGGWLDEFRTRCAAAA